jgi:hypothetical protein
MNEAAINYHIKADTPAIIATSFALIVFVASFCSQVTATSRAAALTELAAKSETDVSQAAAKCQKSLDDVFKEEKKPK